MASEELEAAIEMMGELTLFSGDIATDRANMAGAGLDDAIPHEMVTIGACQAALIAPPGTRDDAAVLYLHGGGYVLGGIGSHGPFGAALAAATATPVLVLDYRLGPEHHHPAALDDALSAFDWLGSARSIPPNRIIVAGDSAGGGLTLAMLAALRDRGIAAAGGVALSPWTDLTCTNPSHERLADADPLVTTDALLGYARAYAGDGALDDPMLSPAYGDLSGLAPVLLQVGGREVLLDDSLVVATAIEAAGGEVTLQRWDEAIHVFQMFGTPESADAVAEIVRFVDSRLG